MQPHPLFTTPQLVCGNLPDSAEALSYLDVSGRPLGGVVTVETAPRANPPSGPLARSSDYEIRDAAGTVVLRVAHDMQLSPPVRRELTVTGPDGTPVGQVAMGAFNGTVGYTFTVNGAPAGGIAPQRGLFRKRPQQVLDHHGQLVAEYNDRLPIDTALRHRLWRRSYYVVVRHRSAGPHVDALVLAGTLVLDFNRRTWTSPV